MNQPRTITEQEFRELQERYRTTSDQLNQMKGTLDAVMVQRNQPQAQAPSLPKTRLTPEAQEDVVKLASHLFQTAQVQQQETFRQAYNDLWNRTDLAEFRATRPGVYEQYKDKIENLRQEKIRQGQFISRDEAYKFVHFDETGKKPPVQAAVQEPPKPVFDPYLNQWVLPDASKAQPQADVNAQPQPNPQAPPQVQPQPQATNTPTVTLDGVQQPQQQTQGDFNLPPQGPMRSTVPMPAASQGPINLDVDSTPQTLESFEAKYGDVPL